MRLPSVYCLGHVAALEWPGCRAHSSKQGCLQRIRHLGQPFALCGCHMVWGCGVVPSAHLLPS